MVIMAISRKLCPGIISPRGYPQMVAVVRKSIKRSPVHDDLIEVEFLDGWRKNLNVAKGAKKASLYKHAVFLFPHGNEKHLAYPETTEAVLQINDKVFPGLFREVQKATEEKWDALGKMKTTEKKLIAAENEIKDLQKKLAMK